MDLLSFIRSSSLSIANKALWEDILVPLKPAYKQAFEDEIQFDEDRLNEMTQEIRSLAAKSEDEIAHYSEAL